MAIKEEMREVVTKMYVTSDGHEFSREWDARNHEAALRREKENEYVRYLEDHAAWYEYDNWSGLSGYLGGEAACVYLIEADETVIEWAKFMEFDVASINEIESHVGQKVFLTVIEDGSQMWFMGTVDDVIKEMTYDIERMEKWRDQKGGTR